ncbi:hypothetical protein NDU88_006999 [Pleurodeles waltl]|uniref:Uncharacterized protein n=1 Tax=Pleurodeles waltl TaxID=8319 RepID=A0AAV7PS97_PLEWA|nr:hypothetical protein NDU88_006999 [Pleurodeles waltl]
MHPQEDSPYSHESSHSERQKKTNRNRATGVGTPSPTEMLKERQKAKEAAASLGSPEISSYKLTQDDHEQSGSEVESKLSHSSDRIGPNEEVLKKRVPVTRQHDANNAVCRGKVMEAPKKKRVPVTRQHDDAAADNAVCRENAAKACACPGQGRRNMWL